MSDSKEKTIKFEYVCSKCEYNNSVEYTWPVKVFEKMGYEFQTFCSECLTENKYSYTETEEIDVEQNIEEGSLEEEINLDEEENKTEV